jgi:uncharacterized protein DUF6893
MLRRLVVGAVFVGLGVMVAKSIPDLARYLKIRRM